jgi:hypothetical protein
MDPNVPCNLKHEGSIDSMLYLIQDQLASLSDLNANLEKELLFKDQ